MDRLTLPKRISLPTESPFKKPLGSLAVPPDPLPTWLSLPLEAKLPMIPAPKGAVVLYTTNLGEKLHESTRDLDFDTTDPNFLVMSNEYRPLHDPHLKPLLSTPALRRRLYRAGFITRDGKVLCTLKEFNDYRQYLRKMHQRYIEQERKEKSMQEGKDKGEGVDSPASFIVRKREERAREVRERFQKQYEADKARYESLMEATEERRRRLREERASIVGRTESRYRHDQSCRFSQIKRKQIEERKRKINILRKWMEEDKRRCLVAEDRRRQKDKERQKKLEENWEVRRLVQQQRLEEEQYRREEAEEQKQKTIREREKHVQRQWRKQQKIFQEINSSRKREKEKREKEYAIKFGVKMRNLDTRFRAHKKGKRTRRRILHSPAFDRSNWDIERSLKYALRPKPEFKLPAQGGISWRYVSAMDIRESATQLGLSDFRGARFTADVVDVVKEMEEKEVDAIMEVVDLGEFHGAKLADKILDRQLDKKERLTKARYLLSKIGFTEFRGAKINKKFSGLRKYKKERSNFFKNWIKETFEGLMGDDEAVLRETASNIVHSVVQIASKVICPAMDTYIREEGIPYKYPPRPTTPTPDDDARMGLLKSRGEGVSVSSQEDGSVWGVIEPSDGVRFASDFSIISDEWSSSSDLFFLDPFGSREGRRSDDLVIYSSETPSPTAEDEYLDSALSAKDSLTLVKLKPSYEKEQRVASLTNLLQNMIDDLADGNLPFDKVMRLGTFLKDLLHEERSHLAVRVSSRPSSISALAESTVHDTVRKIINQLTSGDQTDRQETTSVLADFIVGNTLERMISDFQQEAQTSQASIKPPSETSLFIIDVINNVAREIAEETTEKSDTSGLIHAIIDTIVDDIKKNKIYIPDIIRGEDRADEVETEISMYVKDILKRVASDVKQDGTDLKQKQSLTSLFITDVLNKVAMEAMSERFPQDRHSTVSLLANNLVSATINKCIEEVETGKITGDNLRNLTGSIVKSWTDMHKSLSEEVHPTQDTASVASLKSWDGMVTPPRVSVSSQLLNDLVRKTLSKVCEDLEAGLMARNDITRMAESVSRSVPPYDRMKMKKTFSRSNTSFAASMFVKDTLQKVMKDFDFQARSNTSLAASMFMKDTMQKVIKDTDIQPKSSTSLAADLFVKDTLQRAMKDSDVMPTLSTSLAARTFVKDALQKVMKDSDIQPSSEQVTEIKTPSSKALENFISDVLTKVLTDIHTSNQENTGATVASIKASFDSIFSRSNSSRSSMSIDEGEKILETVTASPQGDDDMDDDIPVVSIDEKSSTVEVVPVADGKELHLNPEIVGHALSAISMKTLHSHLEPSVPDARHSFRNLIHPDIAKIKSLHTESEALLQNQFKQVSSMNLSHYLSSHEHVAGEAGARTAMDTATTASLEKVINVTDITHSSHESVTKQHKEGSQGSFINRHLNKVKTDLSSTSSLPRAADKDSSMTSDTTKKVVSVMSTQSSSKYQESPVTSSSSLTPTQLTNKAKFSKEKLVSTRTPPSVTDCSPTAASPSQSEKLTKSRSKSGYDASTASSRSKQIGSRTSVDAQSISKTPVLKQKSSEQMKSSGKTSKSSVAKKDSRTRDGTGSGTELAGFEMGNNTLRSQSKSSESVMSAESEAKSTKVPTSPEDMDPVKMKSLCGSHTTLIRPVPSGDLTSKTSDGSVKKTNSQGDTTLDKKTIFDDQGKRSNTTSDSNISVRSKRSSARSSSSSISEMRPNQVPSSKTSARKAAAMPSSEKTYTSSEGGVTRRSSSDIPPVRPSSGFRPSNTSLSKRRHSSRKSASSVSSKTDSNDSIKSFASNNGSGQSPH